MKTRFLLVVLLMLAVVTPGHLSAQTSNNPLTGLQANLEAQLSQPRFAQAEWGVKVISMASGKTVFDHNGDKLLKPASNTKMYTAALALDRLGPDYRIKTSFYAGAKPDAAGAIHGDLLVYGRGDPSFASRFNDGDYSKSLQPVIDAFIAARIKHIDGDLIGDDSYFRGPSLGANWTWDDLDKSYGAPASALTIEDNCLDLVFKPGTAAGQPCQIVTKPETSFVTFSNRTITTAAKSPAHIRIYRPIGEKTVYVWGQVPLGSKGVVDDVSVPDAALWFVTLLKAKLAEHGITVAGGVRSINWLEREVAPLDASKYVEVASVQSRPLAEIVKRTLKPSQNQYAQLLLLQVGATSYHGDDAKTIYTEDAGLRELRKFLTDAGIARGMSLLEEGSGLSRGGLTTPSASVQLLAYMSRHRDRDAFIDGLPIAGVDGTLRNRFKGTAVANNLRAKTGSLEYVDALSGYMTTKGGDFIILSIMLNNYRAPGGHSEGRAEVDALTKMLGDFSGKLP